MAEQTKDLIYNQDYDFQRNHRKLGQQKALNLNVIKGTITDDLGEI